MPDKFGEPIVACQDNTIQFDLQKVATDYQVQWRSTNIGNPQFCRESALKQGCSSWLLRQIIWSPVLKYRLLIADIIWRANSGETGGVVFLAF